MNPKLPLHQQVSPGDYLTDLILDHSEDMLILAYTLTNNATRANQIVANVLLDIYFQDNPTEQEVPLHTWLYDLVKEACDTHTISTK
ncbi:MAG TPA: hypothetical protein VGS79_04650 [Puia sp.]|nr:hypothetical protein [Puia sp.]